MVWYGILVRHMSDCAEGKAVGATVFSLQISRLA
jgi:hypothetical protein